DFIIRKSEIRYF
ncbi:helix-turn-helix protein, partial [Haemophilus influenzae]